MTEAPPPIAFITEEDLHALLKRAFYKTLILGVIVSVPILLASGWRNAAVWLTGALISAASILEWQRLVAMINARIRRQKAPRGAVIVVGFFLLRLMVFAAAIFGSLKCFQGSVISMVCGLSLAVVTLTWEALQLLKD